MMEEFGQAVNHMFESQMAWKYDNGVFYINGRDIVCILAGIGIGIILTMFYLLVKELSNKNVRRHRR